MKETEVSGKYQSYGGSWMLIPTAYWNKSPRYVHQTLNTLCWLWANQFLLLLLIAAC